MCFLLLDDGLSGRIHADGKKFSTKDQDNDTATTVVVHNATMVHGGTVLVILQI